MSPHTQSTEQLLFALGSDSHKGLSAAQVEEKRAKYGLNQLKQKKKKSWFARFLDQFKDVMILILIAAAVVSFVIACIEREPKEFFEPLLILLIVVVNAIMGVMQESKAEKALEALKNMSAPTARVIRDGKEQLIEASLLVVGDIIKLEAGDFVAADARLLSAVSLKSEESALTGESVPSEKDAEAPVAENAPLGDRHNMVFSGCSITYGTATAVVVATGMDTEMGKIANLLDQSEETQTPLQKKLAQLGKYLGILALACCAVIFVVGLASDMRPLEIFMIAVSLAVSAIPEGLPVIAMESLCLGIPLVSAVPSVEEIFGEEECGLITENDNKSLLEGIRKMLTDEVYYQKIKSGAERRSKFFDGRRMVREVEQIFLDLMKE